MPEQPNTETDVFHVLLSPAQAQQFWATLGEAEEVTGVSGIFATVNRTLDLNDGGLVLVLHAARLDRETTRKIQALLRAARAETKAK